MDTILVTFFKHNAWANRRLLDTCAGLSDMQFDASATGTYGRLGDTLVHLVAAQERYIVLLAGEQPAVHVHESLGFPGIDKLQESAGWSGEALVRIAETVDQETVLRGTRNGEAYELPVFVPLLQAINHAAEHRSHVATILTNLGVAVPDLDGWAYGEEVGQN